MLQPHTITVPNRPARRAFTLVELMVVIMIIAILSSLTLAGLSGVRQRAREDKTRSTIRKIDAVIRPMYESYRTRRVEVDPNLEPPVAAMQKLVRLRRLMAFEMPDSWQDVASLSQEFIVGGSSKLDLQPGLRTTAVRSYAVMKDLLGKHLLQPGDPEFYGSAECLHLIVSRGGFEPDALEFFRPDEIGDIDGDGASEFLDGWGRPIAFLRWAPGYSFDQTMSPPLSLIQKADPIDQHDPLDPWKRDASGYSLIPLIYSAGPDESLNDPLSSSNSGYGLSRLDPTNPATAWTTFPDNQLSNICDRAKTFGIAIGFPTANNINAYKDNITNHDLASP